MSGSLQSGIIRRVRRMLDMVWYEWLLRRQSYWKCVVEGEKARDRKDWRFAAESFERAARARPSSALPLMRAGKAWILAGEPVLAEICLQKANLIDPLDGRVKDAFERVRAMPYPRRSKHVDLDRVDVDFPGEDWNDRRGPTPIVQPCPEVGTFIILVDGRGRQPSDVRATLRSLLDQSLTGWRALALVDEEVLGHPVTSIGSTSSQVTFWGALEGVLATESEGPTVMVNAGVVLDVEALAWLSQALKFGADAAWTDHDHYEFSWPGGLYRSRPVFFSAPGPYDLRTVPLQPELVVFASHERTLIETALGDVTDAILAVHSAGGVLRHIPLTLASKPSRVGDKPERKKAKPSLLLEADNRPIIVVVPTRDHADLLKACVASLRDKSSRTELLEIRVLDNRSQESQSRQLFERLTQTGQAIVMPMDESFNWARFNNLGARGAPEDAILVFANNDIEMLSEAWDDHLRRLLADSEVGVVGARLLYADDGLQHVGVALGAVAGRPVHEGRLSAPDCSGPLDRWSRTREASAVTGAFMAVRSEVFRNAGEFNEDLAIAYNDLDFCLRVRELGLSVLYCAEIEALHHESKTRGATLNAEKAAWDDAEFRDFQAAWGDHAVRDAFINPHWSLSDERHFERMRIPSRSQVLDALLDPRPSRERAVSRSAESFRQSVTEY